MSEPVTLVGLDFGTTTSSVVVATAQLTPNAVTGRFELDQIRERYRPDMGEKPTVTPAEEKSERGVMIIDI